MIHLLAFSLLALNCSRVFRLCFFLGGVTIFFFSMNNFGLGKAT